MNLTEAAKTLKSPGDCIYRPDWGEDYVCRNDPHLPENSSLLYYVSEKDSTVTWIPSYADLIADDYKKGEYRL